MGCSFFSPIQLLNHSVNYFRKIFAMLVALIVLQKFFQFF